MRARLSIQQFELELSGEIASGRIIAAEALGSNAEVQTALRMIGSAIARPLARRGDPVTSQEAAARTIEFSGKHAVAIFGWLKDHLLAGGTKDEIAEGTGIDAVAVARRIPGLRKTAGVYDSGETRKTPTGRMATVWRVRA